MKNSVIFSILLGILFSAACARIPSTSHHSPGRSLSGKESKILQPDRLEKGGMLVVVPFKPGINVEATDELDRINLNMISSLADRLNGNRPYLEIVGKDKAPEAEFVMEGYVTGTNRPGFMDSLLFRNSPTVLEVSGKLIDLKTNTAVAVFHERAEARDPETSLADLGSDIGINIASFFRQSYENFESDL